MLRLRRTINKLELAIKSSEYFYSHQFMKFHGQIQKIHTHTHTKFTHGARQIWPVWSQVWVINGINIIDQLNHPIVRYLVISQEVILFQSNE